MRERGNREVATEAESHQFSRPDVSEADEHSHSQQHLHGAEDGNGGCRDLQVNRGGESLRVTDDVEHGGPCEHHKKDKQDRGEARVENLMELVSAAREFEAEGPEATLGAFVDRLSLLSEVDEEEGV